MNNTHFVCTVSYNHRCGQSTLRDSQSVKNKDTPKTKQKFKNVYQSGILASLRKNSKAENIGNLSKTLKI